MNRENDKAAGNVGSTPRRVDHTEASSELVRPFKTETGPKLTRSNLAARARRDAGALVSHGGRPSGNSHGQSYFSAEVESNYPYFAGYAYLHGDGAPRDPVRAASCLQKAAFEGDADAQYFLGRMYADGIGVPQDLKEAYFWLYLGLEGFRSGQPAIIYEAFAAVRDAVAELLPLAELADVRKRADHWLKTGIRPLF